MSSFIHVIYCESFCVVFQTKRVRDGRATYNPLFTDTIHNDRIRYNDNLTVTKPLLKR